MAHPTTICWMRRSTLMTFGLTLLYIGYLCLGAYLFPVLEGDTNVDPSALKQLRTEIIQQAPSLSEDATNRIIARVLQEGSRGRLANVSRSPSSVFEQSFFFCATTIATVGYGHVTPVTKDGKIFTMLYSGFGVPLTLLMLTVYERRLRSPSDILLEYLKIKLNYNRHYILVHSFHLTCVLGPIVLFMFIIPAGIFALIEEAWDFVDGLYFCFITLTTIGLGDYVPGENPLQKYPILYKICTTGYILIGLVFMAFAVNTIASLPIMNFVKYFHPSSDEDPSEPEKMPLQTSLGVYGQNYTNNLPKMVPQQVLIASEPRHYGSTYISLKNEQD